jgi:hypothetical protein
MVKSNSMHVWHNAGYGTMGPMRCGHDAILDSINTWTLQRRAQCGQLWLLNHCILLAVSGPQQHFRKVWFRNGSDLMRCTKIE